ncbi:hypothetical protein [Rhodobacter sp. 24-YEA-8]|uniref:hypothetical protein n=1 Tax=Rhodobacter sp. 24-YEA-8 TaxID=1884310 RepID=UPI00115FA2EA|nr:hypothetical protein [Rhodobacter sp. 24-YEA-8]
MRPTLRGDPNVQFGPGTITMPWTRLWSAVRIGKNVNIAPRGAIMNGSHRRVMAIGDDAGVDQRGRALRQR